MYKCIRSFTSVNGTGYYYGNRINCHEYARLTEKEKRNFVKQDNDYTDRAISGYI